MSFNYYSHDSETDYFANKHYPDMIDEYDTPSYSPAYAYQCSHISPGYISKPIDFTVNITNYKRNISDDTMEIETITNKGKVKVKKISYGFDIGKVVENYNDSLEIVFASVPYSTRTYTGVAIIPGEDYISGRYNKYFEKIVKLPGCSKSELNALIGFKIKRTSHQELSLFPHQGICEFDNGCVYFGCPHGITKDVEKYISPSVLKRKALIRYYTHEEDVKKEWISIFGKHPTLCFLSNQCILGSLMYFLNSAGVFIRDFLCIKPASNSNGLTEEKLTAMLSTNDYHKYSTPTLDSGAATIDREHSEIYDGVFLLIDKTFVDEKDKILDGVKSVIRCSQKSGAPDIGRNVTMIISNNAGYIASKFAPQNAVLIETEGVEVNYSADEVERATDEMIKLVYDKALRNPNETKDFFKKKVYEFHQALSNYASGDSLDTLTAMLTIEAFMYRFTGVFRCTDELVNHYKTMINNKGEMILSMNAVIKQEFAAKLSEGIRSNTITAIKKGRDLRFDNDGKTCVVSGDRLLISSSVIGRTVSDLTTAKSCESVIAAFKNDDDLICTDGNTHPFDSHDSSGKYQRLYFYDVPADILDDDVLYMLKNPETETFLLNKEESHMSGFMPLIRDKSGKIAGKRFVYNDVENDSIAIYGQAGEGKSHTKSQIMASRFALGYDVLVFDTGDSDTYEALRKNLSKEFVDENTVFHSLDNKELDIAVFSVYRTASLPSQKKELLGIITAGVSELTDPQTNLLRSVISNLLKIIDTNEPISPDDLMTLLDEEGTTYESLRNRLEPFIEDIQTYGLTKGTWKDFFSGEHKIHVVQINEGYSGNGNQIVDALLAGLFNYKREHPQRPLSVFIDEVQNHNLSASSPIRKILKEGRKHHLSVVAATQDFYARGTEIGSALGKAGMQIHHRPTQNSANLVAAELRWNKADMARFDSMNRGDAIIKGALYNKELKRNAQTIIEGHIYPFTVEDYAVNFVSADNEDNSDSLDDTPYDNYIGTVR